MEEGRKWVWPVVWAVVIGGNLVLGFDWWRRTDQGAEVLERARAQGAALRRRLAQCGGCARRKAALRAGTAAVVGEAQRIVGHRPEAPAEDPQS